PGSLISGLRAAGHGLPLEYTLDGDAAPLGDLGRVLQARQRVHRRADDVVRVRGALALREHVVDAGALQHGADAAAGDDAGSRRGRLEEDDAGVLAALHRVRDRAVLGHRHADHVLLGVLGPLRDGVGHLVGLAEALAHGAVAVADDDDRVEGEPAAALDDLRHAVDGHQPLDEGGLLRRLRAPAAVAVLLRHVAVRFERLKLEAAVAGALGERADVAVVAVAAAVEDDGLDAGRLRPLGETLADGLAPLDRRGAVEVAFPARRRREGVPLRVVDDLGVDVLVRAEDAQARALSGALHLPADAAPDAGALGGFGCGLGHGSGALGTGRLPTVRS